MKLFFASMALLAVFMAFQGTESLYAQESPPPANEVTPDPWPRKSQLNGVTYTMYQPQPDSWDGYVLVAHAAVSIQPAGAKEPIFGVLKFTAKTIVDRVARSVYLQDFAVDNLSLPSAQGDAALYQQGFGAIVPSKGRAISMDRLEAMLAIKGAEQKSREVPVLNEPPKFSFTQSPAVLIPIDGEPVWRSVQGSTLQRLINTRPFVVMDTSNGFFYVHLFDGFVTSRSLYGPWTVAKQVPQPVAKACNQLVQQRIVDLMEGEADDKTNTKPSLMQDLPQLIVTTAPTELVVTDGNPNWVPMDGTMLLYVQNTSANLFRNLNDQMIYILVAGRWFRAQDLAGPWSYVAGKDLPSDFAKIPDSSPKENVKASVSGTMQAQEAVIATQIPNTAIIYPGKVSFTPIINGEPELKPIPNTPLMYVFNSPQPIIMVGAHEWYAVQNGVWFTARSPGGTWKVAVSIPAVIYSIPVSSPLHYVTYVKIYDSTPAYVVVGYTPGYMGTIVSSDGVVVYGTGYTYVSYVSVAVWYPPPVTYGYAASVTWTPWTGWVVGFGFGWAMGTYYACAPAPYWGPMPYAPYAGFAYGPHGSAAVWGPGGWAATTGNVYQHYGSTSTVTRSSAGYNAWTGNSWSNKVGASYNSTTGRISAGQKASVSNVYTGNYAYGQRGTTYNPETGVSAKGGSATWGNTDTGQQNSAKWGEVNGPQGDTTRAAKVNDNCYASHDGNVYKNTDGGGWEKYDNGSWTPVDTSKVPQNVKSQQGAKAAGDSRSAGSSWGSKSWGGGFGSGAGSGGGSSMGSSGGGSGYGRGAMGSASTGERHWGGGIFGGFEQGGGGFGGGVGRGRRR
jgi:hypothetical protein